MRQGMSDSKQPREQRHQDHAHNGDPRPSHELLHALGFGAGVVVAISFQKVNDSPHAQTSAQGNHEGLKNGDSLIEKCHKL